MQILITVFYIVQAEDQEEEEEEEEEEGETCQLNNNVGNSDSSGWSMDIPWILGNGQPIGGPVQGSMPGAGTGTPVTKTAVVVVS